jgi:hypothetical protein
MTITDSTIGQLTTTVVTVKFGVLQRTPQYVSLDAGVLKFWASDTITLIDTDNAPNLNQKVYIITQE